MTETETTGEAQHKLTHTVQSAATLVKAFLFSTVLAVIILVSAVLPVEYGIDPLGIGAALGLSPLVSAEPDLQISQPDPASASTAYQEDSVNITVPAGKGLEYKFHLVKGAAMGYEWSADDGFLFFDFHGEPDGDTTGFFESYAVSTTDAARGTFTASFDGVHGWYWKNTGPSPIVVTLKTQGAYKIVGLK